MTNLNIYRFELLNKAKEQQVLGFYNQQEDLLNTMNDFCSYIHENIKKYTDNQGKLRTFTLGNIQKKDLEKRIISGYFDSAYTGEEAKVKDSSTNNLKFDIFKKDLFSKDFFYLIHVPKKSKFGYLIVERKENHGVKQVFENAFNDFMHKKGVSNFRLQLRQAPPRYFIANFLKHGNLKEFRLLNGIEIQNNHTLDLGKQERIFKQKSGSKEGVELKEILVKLFNSSPSTNERISFLDMGEFEEIIFVLEYGKVTKTFYVKNQEKIRSNIDVTSLIELYDGEPVIESLVKVSLDLITLAA